MRVTIELMKILSLASKDLLANRHRDAAAQKIYYLYLYLSRQFHIDVIDFVPFRSTSKKTKISKNLNIEPVKTFFPSLFFHLGKCNMPYQLLTHSFYSLYSNLLRKRFQSGYDLIVFDTFVLAGMAEKVPNNIKVIYSSHNVEHEWYVVEAKSFHFKRTLLKNIFEMERRLIERSTAVFTVSDQDKATFQRVFHCDESKFKVVPLGHAHEGPFERTDPDQALLGKYNFDAFKRRAIFCGSNFYANQIAVDALIHRVLPDLDASIEVVLIGTISDYVTHKYKPLPFGLRLLGYVENLSEVYSLCDVALNPVLHGSGANMKTIDYLGAGLNVITTEFGMRGFERLRENVYICDINEMSRTINKFMRDPSCRLTRTVLDYHWSHIAEETASYINAIR